MKELIYKVTFLTDVILPATSNTEGNIQQLDFIPGSNFLGMVAREYPHFTDSFNVFHSGSVRFGDATLLKSDKQTYKIPLSYFHEKLDDSKMYNHHYIKDFKQFNQPKQKRSGYITKENELVEVTYIYAQKSAYDKENRRSKDGSMYGYSAIQSGTTWQFSITLDTTVSIEDESLLRKTIIGKQRLGKSKSAQFGLVNITEEGRSEEIEKFSDNNEVLLYANSRLSLVDEEGNPTYDLKYLCSGLSDADIVYEKTQIRTSSFTPYNTKRETKDYERICINKGSVIVLENIDDTKLSLLKQGVGAYNNEGFGELLINPQFLLETEAFSLHKETTKRAKKNQKEKIEDSFDDSTVQFLVNKHNVSIDKLTIANEVAAFIAEYSPSYSKKMNAQWGTIRSICAGSTDATIEDDVKTYISKGVAKDKWDGNKGSQLLSAIKKSSYKLRFTKLLSIQMPKVKDQK